MRFIILFFGLIFSIASMSGCNTMEGMGEDLEEAGEAIEEEAEEEDAY